MNPLDEMLAKIQRNITYGYMILFGACLGAFIFLPKPLDESIKAVLIGLTGVLGTLITMQNQFWFARSRSATVPDPTTTTTELKQTTLPSPPIQTEDSNDKVKT